MKTISRASNSYDETLAFARDFSAALHPGDILCLYGDLGAGKTAFVKGMASGLGIPAERVSSPTFVLMNTYQGRIPVYHFDLYRICAGDLFDLGYEEFFYGNGIAVIEWAERLEDLLPACHWRLELSHAGEDRRMISLSAHGEGMHQRLEQFEGQVA